MKSLMSSTLRVKRSTPSAGSAGKPRGRNDASRLRQVEHLAAEAERGNAGIGVVDAKADLATIQSRSRVASEPGSPSDARNLILG
jgi:hypothetical protein